MHGYHQRGRMTDDNRVIVHHPATTVAIDFAKVPILSFLSARRVVLGSPAAGGHRTGKFGAGLRRAAPAFLRPCYFNLTYVCRNVTGGRTGIPAHAALGKCRTLEEINTSAFALMATSMNAASVASGKWRA